MNLEGKVMGYDKKIVAIVVLVLAALVIFYAGTRFEKMRINNATKSSNSSTEKKTKAPKIAPTDATAPVTEIAPVAPTTTTPAPKTTTPKATTPVYPTK